jgi:uncharacterized membrane protein YdfJ with MMPL/SSD domain
MIKPSVLLLTLIGLTLLLTEIALAQTHSPNMDPQVQSITVSSLRKSPQTNKQKDSNSALNALPQ